MNDAKLDLQWFVRRSQVLSQYRRTLRAAKRLGRKDPDRGADVAKEARTTYRAYAEERDGLVIRGLVADGRRQLQLLESLAEDDASDRDRYPVGEGWPWER